MIMKSSPLPKKSRGFALMALLCAITVMLVVFAGVMYWVASNSQQMRKNEVFTTSEAAAEAMSEYVFGNMDRDYLYGNLNSANYYQSLTLTTNNWPVMYSFNISVSSGPTVTNLQYLGSQYTNLLGLPQTNTVTVTATPIGQPYNIASSVSQTFIFASIPAFQFAIFYNINLELDPSQNMPVQGAVFSNAGIWSGTPDVTYSSTVEAAGQVTTNGTDPFASGKSDSGTPHTSFLYSSSPPQPESDCNPLHIPIGASDSSTNNNSTNVQAIINIPPDFVRAPNSAAYAQTNQVYDFNAANMIVSNWIWGINGVAPWSNCYTVYLQDNVQNPYYVRGSAGTATNWIMLTNNFFIISNRNSSGGSLWAASTNWVPGFRFTNNTLAMRWTNNIATNGPIGTNWVWYAGFSFLTNVTFYDFREQATVMGVQVDVGKLGAWITNSAPNGGSNWNEELCEDVGHGINSMFVYNAVPFVGQTQLPGVRVMDGQLLPSSTCSNTNGGTIFTSGFTFATPFPMYVMGNYNVQVNGGTPLLNSHNTANTYPAAFLADAITILSPNWSDSYSSGSAVGSRTPVNTTVNAGCLEGIVQSVGNNYSGGVENFLRLLENWSSSTTLTYNGSIMVMFPSSYGTNLWGGGYYGVPKRDWGFDTNFLIQSELPPLTPQFRAVVRNTWSGY
jgi:type II secretory pathway pseudopilin PulG